MTPNLVGKLLSIGLAAWFVSLCIILLAKFMRGDLSLRHLLAHRLDGRLRFHRLQSLIITLVLAGMMIVKGWRAGPTNTLPDISLTTLICVAVSYGLLLGGKAFSR